MTEHRQIAITDDELSRWAATRADDAGRLARELVERRAETANLVVAAREFWDAHNDLSEESTALDIALEPFSARIPYANEPCPPPSPQTHVGGVIERLKASADKARDDGEAAHRQVARDFTVDANPAPQTLTRGSANE